MKQEIRQAIIKRNALMPGASKKRLAAKKAKADMLKRSDRSQGGSSDAGAGSDRGPPEDSFDGKQTGTLQDASKGKRPSTITAAAG